MTGKSVDMLFPARGTRLRLTDDLPAVLVHGRTGEPKEHCWLEAGAEVEVECPPSTYERIWGPNINVWDRVDAPSGTVLVDGYRYSIRREDWVVVQRSVGDATEDAS